jgi:hypothetical protein
MVDIGRLMISSRGIKRRMVNNYYLAIGVMSLALFLSPSQYQQLLSTSDPCFGGDQDDCRMSVHIDTCYIFAENANSDDSDAGDVEYKEQKLKQCDHDIPTVKTMCELAGNPYESCSWENLDKYLELRDLTDDIGGTNLYCQTYPKICEEHNLITGVEGLLK